MGDFDNTAPAAAVISASGFVDYIDDEGLTFDVVITGDVSCTFTTPYRGILKPKPGRSNLLSLRSVGGVTVSLPPDEWEDGYEIDEDVEVNLRIVGGEGTEFEDSPVSDQVTFKQPPDIVDLSTLLASLTFNNAAPGQASLSSAGFDNTPAVPVSTASSTTVYSGSSASATLTAEALKSALASVTATALARNYTCSGSGYKYLAVPQNLGNPTTIRDLSTGFAVPLAGSSDGYSQTDGGGNSYASLVIDGVTYRVYRSLYSVGADLTLQVA